MANQHNGSSMNQRTDTNSKNTESVMNKMENMDKEQMDQILSSFNQFKDYLGKQVSRAESMGMNEEQMAKAAEKVGNYLADNVDPRNREEKLLQELWRSGNEEQQHMLAHMLVRMAQNEGRSTSGTNRTM